MERVAVAVKREAKDFCCFQGLELEDFP